MPTGMYSRTALTAAIEEIQDACPGTAVGTPVGAKDCPPPAPAPASTKSAIVTTAGTKLYKDIQFKASSASLRGVFLNLPDRSITSNAAKESRACKRRVELKPIKLRTHHSEANDREE